MPQIRTDLRKCGTRRADFRHARPSPRWSATAPPAPAITEQHFQPQDQASCPALSAELRHRHRRRSARLRDRVPVPSGDFGDFVAVTREPTSRDYAALKAKWGVSIQAVVMRGRSPWLDGRRAQDLAVQAAFGSWLTQARTRYRTGRRIAATARLQEQRLRIGRAALSQAEPIIGLPAFTIAQLARRAA
jgi:hypothetical protein